MKRNMLIARLMVLALALLLAPAALAAPPQAYEVHNIDVGQGTATLVRTLGGKNILMDTGWDFAGDRLTAYLQKQGIRQIDALVISHRHMDHIGGVQKLSEKFAVKQVIGPWAKDGIPLSAMAHLGFLRDDLSKPHSPQNRPRYDNALKGKVFDFGGGFHMESIWPPVTSSGKRIGDYNEESVVMKVVQKAPSGKGASFLWGGDLGVKEERWLARNMAGKLKADWMVANHHGSKGSSQREYMVAADGGYSPFLRALIAGPEQSDPRVYHAAERLKELSKGRLASVLMHNVDPLAANKVPIRAQWLKGLVKDIRQINDTTPGMKDRYAIFSVGPNGYGHPNAVRMAESQLAGFTPITTWANGSVIMKRTLKGKDWDGAWTPTANSSKDLPTVKVPGWLGKQDPERPYNNDRREANQHWSKQNPHPEVNWETAVWDTSKTWRSVSRELSKGRKQWVENYVALKHDAEQGTINGVKPRAKADQEKVSRDATRKLARLQYKGKREWHGLRTNQMRELTREELQRIAIKRENPNRIQRNAVVKKGEGDNPVSPDISAPFPGGAAQRPAFASRNATGAQSKAPVTGSTLKADKPASGSSLGAMSQGLRTGKSKTRAKTASRTKTPGRATAKVPASLTTRPRTATKSGLGNSTRAKTTRKVATRSTSLRTTRAPVRQRGASTTRGGATRQSHGHTSRSTTSRGRAI